MQRLNLGGEEKSVWWDDKPFQISTTRSEKNEDHKTKWPRFGLPGRHSV